MMYTYEFASLNIIIPTSQESLIDLIDNNMTMNILTRLLPIMCMNYIISNHEITYHDSPILIVLTHEYEPITVNSQYEPKVSIYNYEPKKAKP